MEACAKQVCAVMWAGKLILVEPSESRALVGKPHTKHSIFGIGAGCALPFIENLAPGKPYEEGPRGIIDEFCEALARGQLALGMLRVDPLLPAPEHRGLARRALCEYDEWRREWDGLRGARGVGGAAKGGDFRRARRHHHDICRRLRWRRR